MKLESQKVSKVKELAYCPPPPYITANDLSNNKQKEGDVRFSIKVGWVAENEGCLVLPS